MHTSCDKKSGIREIALENGLKLLTMERPRLPIVTVMMWYRIGSCHCTAGNTGIAHLIEHLMFKGTSRLKRGEIDAITQESGGSNNAFTSADYTCYYFNFPTSSWEVALEIEADRMINCRWTPREFAHEKNVVLEELAASLDSPLELVTQEAETLCYQRHPYRYPILGWREDLRRMTLPEVTTYYRNYYAPNNAILVVVGDVKIERVLSKVQQLFGHIPSGAPIPTIEIEEPQPSGQKRLSTFQEVKVPRFAFLFPSCCAGTFDDCVLDLTDIILSCGRSSRLFRRLVIEETLVHHIGTYHNSRKYGGIFWIHGELTPETNLTYLEDVISEELKKLSCRPPGKYELQKARNIYLANFIFDQETNYEMANQIGRLEVVCNHHKLSKMLETVKRVQPEDIQKATARYLNMQRATVVWSLPKNGKIPAKTRKRKEKKMSWRGVRIPKISPLISLHYNHPGEPILKYGYLPVQHYVLQNGLNLLVLKNSAVPCASLELHCKRIYDAEGKEGTGYLAGQLLQEGTQRRSAEEIARTVDFLGAEFTTHPSGVSAKFLTKDIDFILDLVSDVTLTPLFHVSALHREKQKAIASLLAQEDNPFYRGKLAFRSIVYGGHPYGKSLQGTPETIARITRKDLIQYFKRRFIPNQAALVVAGDVEPLDVYLKAQKVFKNWKAQNVPRPVLPKISLSSEAVTRYIPMEKQQVVVYWGHLGVERKNRDYYKLRLLDQILGEGVGFTDRLSSKIRDRLGLCYSIEASTTAYAGEEPGLVTASFSTSPANYRQALAVLVEEIERLKNHRVRKSELASVKQYMTNSFWFTVEENDALVSLILRIYLYELGFDYIHRFITTIQEITPEDIREVARQYLHPERAATVVVGAVDGLK